MQDFLEKVKQASRKMANVSAEKINQVLLDLADTLEEQVDTILEANKVDAGRMDAHDPKYDRLLLNKERLQGIAQDIKNVASLPTPLGKVFDKKVLKSGIERSKITVPIGVIGIIYEARPNVTFDVFSLCFKSGNAVILKGGSDAIDSNTAIVKLIHSVLEEHDIDRNVVHLLGVGREEAQALMGAVGYVDVIIPRGSQDLINYVREHTKVPVIETGAGIVHTYVDASSDLEKAKAIVFNAKTFRVSVCNALDTLLIHESRLGDLVDIVNKLASKQVTIFADHTSYEVLKGKYPDTLLVHATDKHFGTEFLDYKMSIKTVVNIDEAVEHIAQYSSKHSEAIIAEDVDAQEKFLREVDAACVYANASTAFTDGAQFGLGAEIGISTQKLHARGPMALEELTSYKWILRGHGETRE